jgi:hypothetical protein
MVWREVTGFAGYEVSETGLVRNACTGRGRKLRADKDGYLLVDLRGGTLKVHRLVALAFVPGFFPGAEVNHKDGKRSNNIKRNLEWVTGEGNRAHTRDVLKSKVGRKGRQLLAIAPDKSTLWFESALAAKRAGHNRAAIYLCLEGKQNMHHGYEWSYAA